MVKRKMPPHIVLPNGQWRFVKRGAKTRSKKRGGGFMAKKKSGRRRGGMGGIMSLAVPFAIGAVAGAYSDRIPVLNTLPPIVSGAAGGYIAKHNAAGVMAGVVGSVVGSPILKNMTGGSSSGGW